MTYTLRALILAVLVMVSPGGARAVIISMTGYKLDLTDKDAAKKATWSHPQVITVSADGSDAAGAKQPLPGIDALPKTTPLSVASGSTELSMWNTAPRARLWSKRTSSRPARASKPAWPSLGNRGICR